jgi:hypothetical protein
VSRLATPEAALASGRRSPLAATPRSLSALATSLAFRLSTGIQLSQCETADHKSASLKRHLAGAGSQRIFVLGFNGRVEGARAVPLIFINTVPDDRIAELLANWPHPAKLIVVTDGERDRSGRGQHPISSARPRYLAGRRQRSGRPAGSPRRTRLLRRSSGRVTNSRPLQAADGRRRGRTPITMRMPA